MSERYRYPAKPRYGETITPAEAGREIDLGIPRHLLPSGQEYGIPGEIRVPNAIVLHTTQTPGDTAISVYEFFRDRKRGASTQLAVGKAGDAVQMARFYKNGVDRTYGCRNYPATIGIEMTELGVYNSREETPAKQFETTAEITLSLMEQYAIPLGDYDADWHSDSNARIQNLPPGVYGHYQLNPETKTDPGIGFLRDLRKEIKRRQA